MRTGGDRGPPIIRTHSHPNGLPEGEIDPKHIMELKLSNLLLKRTVDIAIAAVRSPARATIIIENPADRSPGASIASSDEFKDHGSLFQTDQFKRLVAEAGLTKHATFAYCMLGAPHQKYTTLYYTPDAAAVLDVLNGPEYQCCHERGSHKKRAGGRGPDGSFVSGEAVAYPDQLNSILARALTLARTGGSTVESGGVKRVAPTRLQTAPPPELGESGLQDADVPLEPPAFAPPSAYDRVMCGTTMSTLAPVPMVPDSSSGFS